MPRSPSHFDNSLASCPDPLVFQGLSGIVLGSPSHFNSSSVSCLDPLVIRPLSGIVPGSPSHFGGPPTSCPDPLVIQRISSIVAGFPSHFNGSPTSCPDPLVIPTALRHRAQIPYFSASCSVFFYLSWHRTLIFFVFSDIMPESLSHFDNSSASCPNPLFSNIVSNFLLSFPTSHPDFLCFLQHRAQIPYFSASCLDSFYLSRHRAQISFVFFGIMLGSYISPGNVSSFLLSFLALCPDSFSFLRQYAWVLWSFDHHVSFP